MALLALTVEGFGFETVRQGYEAAVAHVGHHVAEGHAVWAAYLAWEDELQSSMEATDQSEEEIAAQSNRVRALYSRALHAPLEGLELLWQQYEEWEVDDRKKTGLEKRKAAGVAGRNARRPWEKKVAALSEAGQDQNAELYGHLCDYLSFEEQQLGGKKEKGKRDPSSGTSLLHRGLAVFGALPKLWLRAASFVSKWAKAEARPEWASSMLRHCPWSGAVVATAARFLFASDVAGARTALEQSLQSGLLASADDYHAVHCVLTDLAGEQAAPEAHLQLLDKYFGDRPDLKSDVLEWQAAVALRAGRVDEYYQLWDKALRAWGGTSWDAWSRCLGSCPLGSELQVARCRTLFKQAVHAVLDNPGAAFEAWRKWERVWGTPETQLEAMCAMERRGRAVAALRAQWQQKEAGNAPTMAATSVAASAAAVPAAASAAGGDKTRRTLFVKNLLFEASEEQLREQFAPFGEVADVRLVRDAAGASKGFGFVEFASVDACGAALVMDGKELQGRRLVVMPSVSGAGDSGMAPQHTLYVSNLPYEAQQEDVAAAFAAAGATAVNPIRAIRMLKDSEGKGKGGAFVDFTKNIGPEVLKLDSVLKVRGRAMRIEFAKSKAKPRVRGEGGEDGERGEEEREAKEPENKRAKKEEAGEEQQPYDDSKTLFVGSLAPDATEEAVAAAFEGVVRVRLVRNKDGSHRGRAYVDFASVEARDAALQRGEARVGTTAATVSQPKPRDKGRSLKVPQPHPAPAGPSPMGRPTVLLPPSLARLRQKQQVKTVVKKPD